MLGLNAAIQHRQRLSQNLGGMAIEADYLAQRRGQNGPSPIGNMYRRDAAVHDGVLLRLIAMRDRMTLLILEDNEQSTSSALAG